MRFSRLLAALTVLFVTAIPALAQEYGTPAEAKAMLDKAVAALKVDQAKALQMFTKGEGGFRDKDLYPYCGGPDGNFTAHPTLVGKSLKDLMDKSTPPKPLGQEVYAAAQPGKISEVSYMFPAARGNRGRAKGRLRHESRRSGMRRRLLQALI